MNTSSATPPSGAASVDAASPSAGASPETNPAYQVLARKYRPHTFAGLIGQEAMVRTLTNAIQGGRLAHAFMLTGVRGIGKTSTARIIARALNCIGPDGQGGPTVSPCGVCPNCKAITEDRHVDVMEMDAASRTGVDDIREILDGVRYRPVSARFKIYIIDEVHMLSKNAFNALLKTLEEPPEHVKFLFATTEIRKVPVTVLSRCQRFDLRRVEISRLKQHFAEIAQAEKAEIDDVALAMIARAADGSVRDGLSLLDQAISHCAGKVGEANVRDMLGLADRGVTFDLIDAVFRGDARTALETLSDQHRAGADAAVVLEDMLDLTHWLTRLKVVPDQGDIGGMAETERVRGAEMAGKLSMAALTRAWQLLLKGLGEVRAAPSPLQAAEMILIRLCYAAELPSPADAVKAAGEGRPMAAPKPPPAAAKAPAPPPPPPPRPQAMANGGGAAPRPQPQAAPEAEHDPRPEPPPWDDAPTGDDSNAPPRPTSFAEVVELANQKREMVLWANLMSEAHLVRFEPGRIEFRPTENAPGDLANRLSNFLNDATGERWVVTVSGQAGEATMRQTADAATAARIAEVSQHPLVRSVLDTFPGAAVERVRSLTAADAPPAPDAVAAEGPEYPFEGDDDL